MKIFALIIVNCELVGRMVCNVSRNCTYSIMRPLIGKPFFKGEAAEFNWNDTGRNYFWPPRTQLDG